MTEYNTTKTFPRLMTITQFVEANPAFTMGGMRSIIFQEDKYRLEQSGVIKRIGKKLLIDTDRFFVWLDSQGKGA